MRWRKASMRSCHQENDRNWNYMGAEEDEENFISSMKKSRNLYETKKKSFEKSHKNKKLAEKQRFCFSPTTGVFPTVKEKNNKKKTDLGLPSGNYIYHSPPSPSSRPFVFWRNEKEDKDYEYKITRTEFKPVEENDLSSKIFKILLEAKAPLHINDIIISLKGMNSLNQTNHIYSVVYRTLTRNHALFVRSGKATFFIRKGFLPWEKSTKIIRETNDTEELASLQQLVAEAVHQLYPTGFSSPSDIFQFLSNAGYNGTYDSIYSSMQSSLFRRDGANYSLVSIKELSK